MIPVFLTFFFLEINRTPLDNIVFLRSSVLTIACPCLVMCVNTKGETITRVNGNVSFTAGKRLQNF